MDIDKLQVNDSGHNKVLSKRMNAWIGFLSVGAPGCMNGHHETHNGWYLGLHGGANFLHY